MTRKSITIDEDAFARLEGHKQDGESWTEFADRVADFLESQDGNNECGLSTPDDVLTEDHLDDIGSIVERRVESALEQQTRL